MAQERDSSNRLAELTLDDIQFDEPADTEQPTDPESDSSPPAPLESSAEATNLEPDAAQPGSAPADLPADAATNQPNTIEWTPTGDPLRFRIAGQDITPNGAVADDKYVHIPRPTWDAEIAPKYLGPVEQWTKQVAGYQAALREKVKQLESLAPERDLQVQAATKFLKYMADAPDEELAQFILDRRQALPLKIAEMKLALVQEQQQTVTSQAEQQRIAQEDQQVDEALYGAIEQRAKAMLGTKDYALLADDPHLISDLQTQYGNSLFRVVHDEQEARLLESEGFEILGYGAGSLKGKLVGFNGQALREVLDRRVTPLKGMAAKYEATKAAAAHNAKVLAPAKVAAPAPQRPRNPDGRFVEASKSAAKPKRRPLYDMTVDDIEDED